MRKLCYVVGAVALIGLFFGSTANACPKPKCSWKNCVCKCFNKHTCKNPCKKKKCPCGKTCKWVKKCKVYKHCKMVNKCCKVNKCKKVKVKISIKVKCGFDDPCNNSQKCCYKYKYVWKNKCKVVKKCKKVKKCSTKKCCKWKKVCKCKKCPPCPPCPDSGPPPVVPDMSVPDSTPPPVDPDVGVPDSTPPPVDPDVGVPDSEPPVEPDMSVPDSEPPVDPDVGVPDSEPPVEPDSTPPPAKPDSGVVNPDLGVEADSIVVVEPDAGPPAQDMEVEEPDAEIIESDGRCENCPDGFKEEIVDLKIEGGGCSMSGNGVSMTGIMFMFLIGLGLLIARKKSSIISILCVLLLSGGVAFAKPKLPAPKFLPANTPADYFTTRQADVVPHLNFSAGTLFSYERRPLELLYDHNDEPITDIVQHRYNLDLLFAIGLLDRFEFGLAVPFAIGQVTKGLNYLGEKENSSLDGGIGDLRFYPKMKIWKGDYFGLGLVAPFTAPTASPGDFFGEEGPTFSPAVLFDFNTTYFGAAINAGYRFREDQTIKFRSQEIVIDDEVFGSLGLRATLLKNKIDLLGDAFFSMATAEQDEEEIPVEILGGLRFHLPYGVTASVGAGAGLTRGAGAPTYRILGGVSWSPPKEKVRKVFVAVKLPPKIIRTKCPKCPECPPAVVCTECGEVVIPPVFFDFDKDYLTATSRPVMLKIVEMIKKNPQIKKVVLHGHTDNKGSVKYNDDLGIRRAEHVLRILLKNNIKVKESRSWSELKPYISNKTKDGRAQNRRVEFEIVR